MSKTIYIIAGEASGDVLGGRLMSALRTKSDFSFCGIGGDTMQQQGLKSLFPMAELSVMGVFEILPKIPKLLKRIRQTADDIIIKQPDIVITIDSPDFCKRVVKRIKKHCPNTKFIHYVAPTVWAWRAGRAKIMANIFDGLICLLPFEPPYFEREGLCAKFCGHPMVEAIITQSKVRDKNKIIVMPGSRVSEIKTMAPIFAEVFKNLQFKNKKLKAIIPVFPHLKNIVMPYFQGLNNIEFINPSSRYEEFQRAGFAIAKSGTSGLELAVACCPHVIAYKMNSLTWILLKCLSKVKFAHLVNIMEHKEIIPECLQDNCNTQYIQNAIENYSAYDLSEIHKKLAGEDAKKPPSLQAAEFVLSFLND